MRARNLAGGAEQGEFWIAQRKLGLGKGSANF
jgi:hypothetical protein